MHRVRTGSIHFQQDLGGVCVQAVPDGPGDGSQEAGGTGKPRSRRGEVPSKRADAASTGHKSSLSCFGMPQVADDEGGSTDNDSPLLIEVCPWARSLACHPPAIQPPCVTTRDTTSVHCWTQGHCSGHTPFKRQRGPAPAVCHAEGTEVRGAAVTRGRLCRA